MSYSPQLRTAVLLTGTGTAGAYHGGVLRALHEAGIKIDVMAGRGVGAVGALFAAIDAAPKTWEDGGLWRRKPGVRLYRWRAALRMAGLFLLVAAALLTIPLLVLSTGLIAYPLSFLVQMISVDRGHQIAAAYASLIDRAFAPGALPTIVPRLSTLMLACAVVTLVSVAVWRAVLARTRRASRSRGRWWGRMVGAPWSADPIIEHSLEVLWQLFRGPVNAKRPSLTELSRRYAELLWDNLSQPGFRELLICVGDIESRTDLVFAALAEPRRRSFFERNRGDLVDLAGTGRAQALDALAGAVSLPVLTAPYEIAFSPESYWKGEVHRVCDRPAAVGRLLQELSAAGVEQVIVVTATADRSAPHRLSLTDASLEARVSEQIALAEAAAVRDAVAAHAARFAGVFVIQPAHNPVGPFDFEEAYDDRSDRFQSVREVVDRGYEDAYRQFIEPVVGEA